MNKKKTDAKTWEEARRAILAGPSLKIEPRKKNNYEHSWNSVSLEPLDKTEL